MEDTAHVQKYVSAFILNAQTNYLREAEYYQKQAANYSCDTRGRPKTKLRTTSEWPNDRLFHENYFSGRTYGTAFFYCFIIRKFGSLIRTEKI